MLRGFFILLSKAGSAQRLITRWRFASRVASRFVAGETPDDALRVAATLNAAGLNVTLDHLGEHTTRPEEATQAAVDIIAMFREIDRAGVRGGMSIKLTQIGLNLSEDLCRANLIEILEAARQANTFVRIDMEEAALVEPTLQTYLWARSQGFDNLGVVIQSYLYRSEEDIHRVLAVNGRIRLVKGAYRELAKVAFPKKKDVDANFDHLVTLLLTHARDASGDLASLDGCIPPLAAIGTHDPRRLAFAQALAEKLGLPNDSFEFQMLYGIRRDLQQELVAAGYPVRIYVPYGTRWYPYLMRRMAERPANLWFVLSNFFRG